MFEMMCMCVCDRVLAAVLSLSILSGRVVCVRCWFACFYGLIFSGRTLSDNECVCSGCLCLSVCVLWSSLEVEVISQIF
ncbi:hypothetical protein QBC38DRAFT_468085, partial [Podospora fimiseda]